MKLKKNRKRITTRFLQKVILFYHNIILSQIFIKEKSVYYLILSLLFFYNVIIYLHNENDIVQFLFAHY